MTTHLTTRLEMLGGEFDALFASQKRERMLQQFFESLIDDQRLRRFFYHYVEFNSKFAAGVASLSAAIHVQDTSFLDRTETNIYVADRSADIASHVFRAAEDEYAVTGAPSRVTHRRLAQTLLKRVDAMVPVVWTAFGEE
jgi:hypothetical protein